MIKIVDFEMLDLGKTFHNYNRFPDQKYIYFKNGYLKTASLMKVKSLQVEHHKFIMAHVPKLYINTNSQNYWPAKQCQFLRYPCRITIRPKPLKKKRL